MKQTLDVNVETTGDQKMASVAMLDADNFVVAWSGQGTGDADGVFVRQYGTALTPGTNSPPTANAGGPYSIAEGGTLSLDGTGSTDPESAPLTYEWDLNYNGTFSADVTGATASVNWATLKTLGIDDNGITQVALRVSDGTNWSSVVTNNVTVTETAPTLTVTGSTTAVSGSAYTLNLNAADPGNDTISQWVINWGDGSVQTVVGNPATVTHTFINGGFTNNILVSATDEDGTWTASNLFVTSNLNNQLFGFDGVTGATTSSEAALVNPVSVTPGPDGLLYVTEVSSHDIDRYDPATGAYLDTFVYGGSGGLNQPSRVAFGPDGNLYVTSMGTNQVLRYSGANGRFLGAFVYAGAGGLNQPDGITFGPDGNLYVSSYANGTIRKFDGTTGVALGTFATLGTATYSDLSFGPDGHLYASSTTLNVVRKFDGATGTNLGTVVDGAAAGMISTAGFLWGADGNLYVADFGGDKVFRFTPAGNLIGTFVPSAAGLSQPIDLAFSPALQVRVNSAPVGAGETYSVSEGGDLNVSTAADWFNSNWSSRTKIVFNNASGTAFTDQAVLVRLHASAADAVHIDYSHTQDHGEDLRFTDASGNVLDYEIESWNESGYSYVWVQVPSITAGSTTDYVWMYYDNSAAEDHNAFGAAWTNDDLAVLHLTAASYDSTSNNFDAAMNNVAAGTGIVGGAALFDGTSGYLNLQSDNAIDDVFSGGGTISAWIRPTGWGQNGFGRIADKASTTFPGGSNGDGWAWQVGGSGSSGYVLFVQGFSGTLGEWRTATGSINLNTWQNVVITYDNSSATNTPKIYINGVEQSLTQVSGPSGTARSDAALDLFVGNHGVGQNRTFKGAIDEFRVIQSTLSASQIAAEYAMVSGTFVSAGATESGPVGLLDNESDADSDPLTVTLVSGPTHGATGTFVLNADGSFFYRHDGSETTVDSFTYAVSDGLSTVNRTVTLNIQPVNDNTPVVTAGQVFSISETAGLNATVGTVSATDTDAGTTFSGWTITAGNVDNAFDINATTGEVFVADPDKLDYEARTSYSLSVTVSDGTFTSAAATVTVNILDENDSLPVITGGQSFTVAESATTGHVLGTVTATDGDAGTVFSNWQIVGGNGTGIFAINGSTGQLTIADPASLDFETTSSYTLTLTVSDGTNTSATQTVSVSVTDVND
ncbi:MAG: DUF2341 domain-containing protein, partial [Planctomycetaceae bacterium]|nr:DUF2341 domain-containing protein [Planctomycetaceae bacterium]